MTDLENPPNTTLETLEPTTLSGVHINAPTSMGNQTGYHPTPNVQENPQVLPKTTRRKSQIQRMFTPRETYQDFKNSGDDSAAMMMLLCWCVCSLGFFIFVVYLVLAYYNVPEYLLTEDVKSECPTLYKYIYWSYRLFWGATLLGILTGCVQCLCSSQGEQGSQLRRGQEEDSSVALATCPCKFVRILICISLVVVAYLVLTNDHDCPELKESWVATIFWIYQWLSVIQGVLFICQLLCTLIILCKGQGKNDRLEYKMPQHQNMPQHQVPEQQGV